MKIAKVYFVSVEANMLSDLKQLPLIPVSSVEDADIVFVGTEFDGDLVDELSAGVVPVLPESYGFIDYNPVREIGDAFNYDSEKRVSAIFAFKQSY